MKKRIVSWLMVLCMIFVTIPTEVFVIDMSASSEEMQTVEAKKLAQPKVKATNVLSSGKIKLTWNEIEGAKEYKIYRATSKNGKYTLMKTVTGTSYTNTSAKAGMNIPCLRYHQSAR